MAGKGSNSGMEELLGDPVLVLGLGVLEVPKVLLHSQWTENPSGESGLLQEKPCNPPFSALPPIAN